MNNKSSFFAMLKKQGGLVLLRNYWRAGVLFYALAQIIITGFSKKSLELLRLGVNQKINRKLKKKYFPVLNRFNSEYEASRFPQKHSDKVWVFWMQGMENAPALVRRCYRSLQENLKDREVVLITSENINDYVHFPQYIMDKLKKGCFSYTHFSDLLRVELLVRYGGTWIDSTVFCSGPNIPDYMMNDDFFVFQNLRPGNNGDVLNFSSWFMTSCSNNKMLLAVRELLYAYWEKNNTLIDYFLIHHFMMIVADYYKEEWNKIVPFPNSLPHVLLLMMFDLFDKKKWDSVTNSCPFHKLAYKRSEEDMNKEGTFFKYLMDSSYDQSI